MTDDDALRTHNQLVRAEAERRRDEIDAAAAAQGASAPLDPLGALRERLRSVLAVAGDLPDLAVQTDLVDRRQFDADLALKFPSLLKMGGPKAFTANHAGWILEALRSPALADCIASVEVVGMYVNVTLTDAWLLDTARAIVDAGEGFGASSQLVDQRFVVDYSSPNVAKTLHAGHIRSTIIGDVLANVFERAGAVVFRVNHINDFGGFGFLLEGHRRFAPHFADDLGLNERSLAIYGLRRTLERATAAHAATDELAPQDAAALKQYLPGATSADDLAAAFADFTAASDERFAALEAGDPDEVALWEQLVAASLADFQPFYDSLAISIDFLLGESFYAQEGLALVRDWVESGAAVVYDDAHAAADLETLRGRRAADEISDAELDAYTRAIEKDAGAVVVRLGAEERYVVLRRDGRSIYATRDLAAIALRGELFRPTTCVYVVGQEQQSHFARLFAASYRLGLADPERESFEHLYFGFYVDARTKKKLSSRESAAGVTELFDVARDYFVSRRSERGAADEDVASVAQELTVASIVFNDLKADRRSSVELDTEDPSAVLHTFEKSGGAYVIYSACRAGSISRKVADEAIPVAPTGTPLDPDEVSLVLAVANHPNVVAEAARQRDVSSLVRHLLDVCNLYNSYYAKVRVIDDGSADADRLLVTQAVERTVRNGLLLCNVDCPESI